MHPRYSVTNSAEIISPALLLFHECLESNLTKMIEIAGDPARLRPHCKTHKLVEVTQMEIARGITRHKAATFAEAEMLANAGVADVFLAYNMVGPNIPRCVRFLEAFPTTQFSVTGDDAASIEHLASTMRDAGRSIEVLIDIDTGQHRTGVLCGPEARRLYELLDQLGGVEPGGLHVYDGQNHQTDLDERRAAVLAGWETVTSFRRELESAGLSVPRIVAGGTGSFPMYAALEDAALELSPGTCVLHDRGYGEMFPDLDFLPAGLLLTRVISRPAKNRVTFDLGYKAVASDPPPDRRVVFPDIDDAKIVLQNEEHLVVETSQADRFQPGDEQLVIPRHICPTSALHKQVYVVEDGRFTQCWTIASRDRQLTI